MTDASPKNLAQRLVDGEFDHMLLDKRHGKALAIWKRDITDAPKIGRLAGSCTIERAPSEFWGIEYDPELISISEVAELAMVTQEIREAEECWEFRLERVLRHCERVRSGEEWPLDLEGVLANMLGVSSIPGKLAALEPGSPRFMKLLQNWRTNNRKEYDASEWRVWHNEWRAANGKPPLD